MYNIIAQRASHALSAEKKRKGLLLVNAFQKIFFKKHTYVLSLLKVRGHPPDASKDDQNYASNDLNVRGSGGLWP